MTTKKFEVTISYKDGTQYSYGPHNDKGRSEVTETELFDVLAMHFLRGQEQGVRYVSHLGQINVKEVK